MAAKKSDGLKAWAKARKTRTIAEALEGKPEIDDPEALAVWLRREALGPAEFKKHQQQGKAKK